MKLTLIEGSRHHLEEKVMSDMLSGKRVSAEEIARLQPRGQLYLVGKEPKPSRTLESLYDWLEIEQTDEELGKGDSACDYNEYAIDDFRV